MASTGAYRKKRIEYAAVGAQPHLSRVRVQKALGKPLPAGSETHHHSADELVLCQDKSYHKLLHRRTAALLATGDPHQIKCSYCKEYDLPENLSMPTNKKTGWTSHYHLSCNNEHRKKSSHTPK